MSYRKYSDVKVKLEPRVDEEVWVTLYIKSNIKTSVKVKWGIYQLAVDNKKYLKRHLDSSCSNQQYTGIKAICHQQQTGSMRQQTDGNH